MPLRLLTYNVLHGGKGREDALARIIAAAAPDVAVLQEVDGDRLLSKLAREGYEHVEIAADGRLGLKVALASRLPLARTAHVPLVPFASPAECALVADVEPPGGRPLTVVGVHLHALHPFPMEGMRRFQFGLLRHWLRTARAGRRHALAGDFNACAPGDRPDLRAAPLWVRAQTWPQLGRLPRWTLRAVERAGYVDCYRRLHPHDAGFTLPARRPHVRLDYVFADAELAPRLVACDVLDHLPGAAEASDHLPLLATFDV
jgi:endonuclease/exonuclease/phosphatase family metal-dependent hydrolase